MRLNYAANILILFIIFYGYAETIILQNGNKDYNGCVDTYIEEDKDTPFGDEKNIKIMKPGCPKCKEQRLLIKFDLSSLADKNISQALLSLYCLLDTKSSTESTGKLYQITKDWDGKVATWVKASEKDDWTAPGGDISDSPIDEKKFDSDESETWQQFDVTDAIQKCLNGKSDVCGFLLIDEGSEEDALVFSSSEASAEEQRPKLEITTNSTKNSYKHVSTGNGSFPFTMKTQDNYCKISLNSAGDYTVSLINSAGKSLFTNTGCEKELVIPHKGIPSGIYFLNLKMNNSLYQTKYVVKNK